MRNRLTQRIAADTVADKGTGIMNDPYQVNNPEHDKNDPEMADYVIGDPEKFGEGVNKDDLWKKDKRDPGTHIPEITAKMAADAIKAGRNLEERAVKCIVAAQRILPGAVDAVVESQAADLLHLPDNMINSLLSRQEDLANSIAKAAADTSEKVEEEKEKEDKEKEDKDASKACKKEDEEDEEVEAASKKLEELQASVIKLAGEIPAALKAYQEAQKAKKGKKPEEKDKEEKDAMSEEEKAEAKDKEEKDAMTEEEKAKAKEKEEGEAKEKDAMTEEEKAEAKEKEEKDAGKKVTPAEEKKPVEEKKEEEEITFGPGPGEEKDASQNLLDDIFSSVIASDTKKGAKSLSGLVKKEASEAKDPLDGIWNAPPDVSSHFL